MTHSLWTNLNEKMNEYLSSVSLADLVAEQRRHPENNVPCTSILRDERAARQSCAPDAATA
jgi:Rrf2 family iron-sulfur cluster assembly transcriptional regulator